MPKPEPKKVSDSDLKGLLPYVPLVGATQVFESDFPGAFESIGVNPRDPTHNIFLRLTVTRPSEELAYFGLKYLNPSQGVTKEDIHALDLVHKSLTHYPRGQVEQIDARYTETHHQVEPPSGEGGSRS